MYKRLIVYLILFAFGVALSVWMLMESSYFFLLLAIPLLVVSVYGLFSVYADSLRKVSFMFNAIESDDYSFRFSEDTADVNRSMFNASLNRIKEIMTNAKIRAMEREKYYEIIMNSVKTGVIIVNDNGNVFQANSEAKRMFGLQVFTHINQLRSTDATLVEVLSAVKSDERKLLSYKDERGDVHLAISASEMTYDGKLLRIIALSNINSALDANEVEAWIKLTRVLTHEIMNSLAPITSLSDTLITLDTGTNSSISKGLETINATAKSLIAFVESYRKFTRLQTPVCEPFAVNPLIERIAQLVCPPHVHFSIEATPDDVLVFADENLIAQVVTNLLQNAVQAVEGASEKRVWVLTSIAPDESITVEFHNTGAPIPAENIYDIFMPFFTTKHGGSGIGLSIAKQVMHLHGGSIRLISNATNDIAFALRFI